LKKFFPRDFFKKVEANMVSCSELEDDDAEEDEQIDLSKGSLLIQMTKSLLS